MRSGVGVEPVGYAELFKRVGLEDVGWEGGGKDGGRGIRGGGEKEEGGF